MQTFFKFLLAKQLCLVYLLTIAFGSFEAMAQTSNPCLPKPICPSSPTAKSVDVLQVTKRLKEMLNCSTTLPPVGDPYIYAGDCLIGINRYLSRGASAQGLYDKNYQKSDTNPADTSSINLYCRMIIAFADLDIQYIDRAFTVYGHEHQLYTGTRLDNSTPPKLIDITDAWYKNGLQIVRDINYAYDCKGKRRPILQGMAFESGDSDNFDAAKRWDKDNPLNSGVIDQIDRNIPAWVINKFFEEGYYQDELE
jgi:hypothetical protein